MSKPSIQLVTSAGRQQRKMRRPKHTFCLQFRPWQIQPFVIAPVLAGESLKNANWKGRIVSDALAQSLTLALTPWWVQTFLFYVKLRDLSVDSDVEAMMLQGTVMPQNDAVSTYTFHGDNTRINWTQRCYDKVVQEYFRDESEAVTVSTIDGVPAIAAIGYGDNFFENLMVDGATPTGNNLQNPHDPTVMSQYAEQYERMRAMRLIDMSFEDWLGTYGVKVADPVEQGKPELLRYTSAWTYPTNTVEPSTGVPSTAIAYSVDESADKDRFFTEPGFLIGLVVCKPKVYPYNQSSSAVCMLDDAYAWLPALMRDEPHTSLAEFLGNASHDGPFLNQSANYWIDRRDLYLHGDHFRNFTPAAAGGQFVSLPTAAGGRKWVDLTAARSLFKDSDASAPHANFLYMDGIINFNIASHPTTATDMT